MYYEVMLTQTGEKRKFSDINDVMSHIYINIPLSNTYAGYIWVVTSSTFLSDIGQKTMEIFPRQLVRMRSDTTISVRVIERMLSPQFTEVAIVEKKYKKPKYTSVW